MSFGNVYSFFMKFNIFTQFSDFDAEGATTKSPDHEVIRFEIDLERDASSGVNSFEIGKLRLSAFQTGAFC